MTAKTEITWDEVDAKYGDCVLTFDYYYKYCFYFKGQTADGNMLLATYGGTTDEIYRHRVENGQKTTVRDLRPFQFTVYFTLDTIEYYHE